MISDLISVKLTNFQRMNQEKVRKFSSSWGTQPILTIFHLATPTWNIFWMIQMRIQCHRMRQHLPGLLTPTNPPQPTTVSRPPARNLRSSTVSQTAERNW